MDWLKAIGIAGGLALTGYVVKKVSEANSEEAKRDYEREKQREFERRQFVSECDALVTKRIDHLKDVIVGMHEDPHGKKKMLMQEVEELVVVLREKPYDAKFMADFTYMSTLFDQLIQETNLSTILELHRKILNHDQETDEKNVMLEKLKQQERRELQNRINELVDRKLSEADAIHRMSIEAEINALRQQLQTV